MPSHTCSEKLETKQSTAQCSSQATYILQISQTLSIISYGMKNYYLLWNETLWNFGLRPTLHSLFEMLGWPTQLLLSFAKKIFKDQLWSKYLCLVVPGCLLEYCKWPFATCIAQSMKFTPFKNLGQSSFLLMPFQSCNGPALHWQNNQCILAHGRFKECWMRKQSILVWICETCPKFLQIYWELRGLVLNNFSLM